MKRTGYLTIVLVGLLCGASLLFTIGAQTASSERHTFTAILFHSGQHRHFCPHVRNSRCLRATPAPRVVITPYA